MLWDIHTCTHTVYVVDVYLKCSIGVQSQNPTGNGVVYCVSVGVCTRLMHSRSSLMSATVICVLFVIGSNVSVCELEVCLSVLFPLHIMYLDI